MSGYAITKESKRFALLILKVHEFLLKQKKYDLASQIVRSGTSIGANIAESQCSPSKKDFLYKNSLALKEANETKYRLEVLREAGYLNGYQDYHTVYEKAKEMVGVLVKIVTTTRKNLDR